MVTRRTRSRYLHNSRGITFVEALMTLLIVSIALVGMMYLYANLGGAALLSNRVGVATSLARSRLEAVLAYKKANGYSAALLAPGTTTQTTLVDAIAYSIQTDILQVSAADLSTPSSVAAHKRVAVAVSWPGSTAPVTLSSVVSNYE